jgi:hypothetical protein
MDLEKQSLQGSRRLILAFILVQSLSAILGLVLAQQSGMVQVVTGSIDTGNGDAYTLPNLSQGEMLYVYAKGTSGNLDPFVGLGGSDFNASDLLSYFKEKVRQNLAENKDPYQAVPETANKFFLKWNDDTAAGYNSALQYKIPKDGNYQLFIINNPLSPTFGDYKMLIGVGNPEVLTGEAEPTSNAKIATLKNRAYNESIGVQELNGSIEINKPVTIVHLNRMITNDTLYAFIKAKSGNLTPIMILKNYGNKTLATGNWEGKAGNATLQYVFENDSKNNYLRIYSGMSENGNFTTGDYRLLLGVNSPGVLTGDAKIGGKAVALKPIEVKTAIQLEQVTGVDQKQANFEVIASLWMEWIDPALAFSPESCQCNLKVFNSIDDFVQAEGANFPTFSFRNLLDDLHTQSQIIAVNPDGRITYFERFAATLSAPNLDLRKYPFDIQKFSIEIDSFYPDDSFVFADWGNSGANSHLGNEEWDVIETYANTSKFSVPLIGTMNSRFSFNFLTKRHIDYYAFRIIIPITLIIILTWLTFFLHKDYMKRIEIVGANLLLFIAYNFTIAGDLPKLGYLTVMDRIIVSTFTVTAVIFAYNVYLRWLDMHGKKDLAERLDKYVVWIYPLAYICGFIIFVIIYNIVYQF